MEGPWRLSRSTTTSRMLFMAFFEESDVASASIAVSKVCRARRARFLSSWSSYLMSITRWTV
jgi:hypothetical protein